MPKQGPAQRVRRWPRSKLQPYRAELVQLRQGGASYRQLSLWLQSKRITACDTTVRDYLLTLPELAAYPKHVHAELP